MRILKSLQVLNGHENLWNIINYLKSEISKFSILEEELKRVLEISLLFNRFL